MRAKKRALGLLVVAVAVLGTLLGWLWLAPREGARQQQQATVFEVVNLPLSELTAVKVENQGGDFAVLNTPQGVEMLSNAQAEYDEGQLRAFLYAAGHITGSRRVTDRDRFGDYGLAAPRSTITLYRSDNTQLRYHVLVDNPVDQSTYLYLEAEDAIYLIPREIAALFLRTPRDFVSHWVLPLRSQEDFAGIRSLQVSYHGTGRDYTLEQTEQGFYLTSPVGLRLSRVNVSSMVLGPLLQLYADEVVDTQADLSRYGLDQPTLEIALTLGEETVSVLFAAGEGNQCLMAQKGGTAVYRLDDAPMVMLSQDYTALLGNGILSYAPGDLTDLTLSMGEKSLFASFTGEGAAMTTTLQGQRLSGEMQTRLLQTLSQLPPVAELSGAPEATPVIGWTATLRTGAREAVALWPLTQDLYAVSIGGTAAFATDAAAVQRLLTLWEELSAL